MRHIRRSHARHRRGIALMDALIGGIMLGISLTVIMAITSRALSMQTDGAKRLTATWLADELLAMVLVDGPDRFPRINETRGTFDPPFEEFSFAVDIDSLGRGAPYKVTASVAWADGERVIDIETIIAQSTSEEVQLREPLDPVDRDARWFDEEEEGG